MRHQSHHARQPVSGRRLSSQGMGISSAAAAHRMSTRCLARSVFTSASVRLKEKMPCRAGGLAGAVAGQHSAPSVGPHHAGSALPMEGPLIGRGPMASLKPHSDARTINVEGLHAARELGRGIGGAAAGLEHGNSSRDQIVQNVHCLGPCASQAAAAEPAAASIVNGPESGGHSMARPLRARKLTSARAHAGRSAGSLGWARLHWCIEDEPKEPLHARIKQMWKPRWQWAAVQERWRSVPCRAPTIALDEICASFDRSLV